jgi:hypothetical protein
VTSVLKLWLRELPEPLLTMHLHQGFLSAASKHSHSFGGLQGQLKPFVILPEIENDRLRHIRLHERVNELPDANYATLKYFLGHLHRYVVLSLDLSLYLTNVASQDCAERGAELDVHR